MLQKTSRDDHKVTNCCTYGKLFRRELFKISRNVGICTGLKDYEFLLGKKP